MLCEVIYMLNFLVKSNTNHTEVELESNELKILLDVMEHQKEICSKYEQDNYEVLYNKIKALYLFDRLPDEQSIKQINHILLSSNNVTEDNIFSLKIEHLQFSKKTFNCLNRANIKTLGELLCLSEEELLKIRNLGIQSLNEIRSVLNQHKLELSKYSNN